MFVLAFIGLCLPNTIGIDLKGFTVFASIQDVFMH